MVASDIGRSNFRASFILKTAVKTDCIAWADKSIVIPAQAGIQESCDRRGILDSRLRGNDGVDRRVGTHPSGASFASANLLVFMPVHRVLEGQLRFLGSYGRHDARAVRRNDEARVTIV
jgi:hypothetical protein